MKKKVVFSSIVVLAIIIGVILLLSKQGTKPDNRTRGTKSQVSSQTAEEQNALKDTIEINSEPSKPLNDGLYSIDISKSKLKWFCVIHKGYVLFKSGRVTVENNKITKGSFEILMDSIVDTDIDYYLMKATLENTLKSDMFFDIEKYPLSVVKITDTKDLGANRYHITGNLRIKDIEKPVSFIASIETNNDTLTAVSDKFSINRTDWGITTYSRNYPQTDDSFLFTDYIDFKIKLVMIK